MGVPIHTCFLRCVLGTRCCATGQSWVACTLVDYSHNHPTNTGLEDFAVLRGLDRLAAFLERRAKGGAALLVTGGISPNRTGRLAPWSAKLSNFFEMRAHRVVPQAVRAQGALVCMQILHAGRYTTQLTDLRPDMRTTLLLLLLHRSSLLSAGPHHFNSPTREYCKP